MLRSALVAALLLPCPALAEGVDLTGLPAKVARKIQRDLDAYLGSATEIIAGYGTDGRLDAGGIDLMVRTRQSRARALALLPLIAADLDHDGALSPSEIAALAAIGSATLRGRFARAVAEAESDGLPGLSPSEIADHGQAEAEAEVGADERAWLDSFLRFDLDGDGGVTRDEVRDGLRSLARGAAATGQGTGGTGAPAAGSAKGGSKI